MMSLRENFRKFNNSGIFGRWEWILILLFGVLLVGSSFISPYFLDPLNLLDMTFNFMEKGIIALIMALIIITGNIDLSVASNMALSAAVMGIAFQSGLNIWAAVFLSLVTAVLGGLFNGLIITKIKLPAIVVTLGTYVLYRGLAYVLLGDTAVTGFPAEYGILGQGYLGTSPVPIQLAIFLILAVIFWYVLHFTVFGRSVYAIGSNEQACRYSNIPVDRIKIILFTLSGLFSAFSAILLTSRIGSARPDIASGYEMEIITAVVLGGVSILGGSGNMIGVVLSLFLIGTARYSMGLLNIPGQVMTVIIGFLLIGAILLTRLMQRLSLKTDRLINK
ncbi:MAG: ABC transporter permease [Bacillota bacterium]